MASNIKPAASIPIIDYALLTSAAADDRSKAIKDLGNACKIWGCYLLVNHGIPESVFQKTLDTSNEFFDMKNEEKVEFESSELFGPISYSNAVNAAEENKDLISSRQCLRLIVNPDFHSPHKPLGFSEVAWDYVERTRVIGTELIKGISESLGFGASYIHEELHLDRGSEVFAVNYYIPSLPGSDQQGALVEHADAGVLTILYENGVPGLEVHCNGEWITMTSSLPNALFVLNADHLEIFSNGIYKRKLHRVTMNGKRKRFSLVRNFSPSVDTIVGPSPRILDRENQAPGYLPKQFAEYRDSMMQGKRAFDEVKLSLPQ